MADEQDKPAKRVSLNVSAIRTVDPEQREADRKSMGQVRNTFVLLAIVGVIYVAYLFLSGEIDNFLSSIVEVDLAWIVAGVVCFMFYYVFGILAYVLSIIRDEDSPVGLRDLMSVEAAGVFFMRMTPESVGAQPAQIFRLTRAGLAVGEATALNFTRSLLYEAGEGIFAAIMLVFCGSYFYDTFGNVTMIGLLLFGFKIIQVGAMLFVCLFPKPVRAIGNFVLKFVHERGWLKEDKYLEYDAFVNTQVELFSIAFRKAAKNVPDLLATLVVTLLQLGCMYALPYFVLRSFGVEGSFMVCLACGSMLELLVNAIPLPGGTGGAEVGFIYLFKGMYGTHVSAGLVIWRAIEYLLPVVIAVPCMGMRSTSRESLNRRVRRFFSRVRRVFARAARGIGVGGTTSGVTMYAGGSGVQARATEKGSNATSEEVLDVGSTKDTSAAEKQDPKTRVASTNAVKSATTTRAKRSHKGGGITVRVEGGKVSAAAKTSSLKTASTSTADETSEKV